MRIVVCVKQIPNPEGSPRFDAGRIVRGEDDQLSELDANAIEAALNVAEQADGEVIALTMGPAGAELAVRRALQLGADGACHVCDDEVAGSDAPATARVLAAAIGHIGDVDLVVCGMGSLDARTSLVPSALAALLDYSQLTMARSVQVADGEVKIERAVDDAVETLAGPLPAVVSVSDQANTPRFPNVKGIMAAKKKPVTRLTLADLGVAAATCGDAGAASHVLSAEPTPTKDGARLFAPDETGLAELADYLIETRLVTKVRA